MIRGIYAAASGMIAETVRTDVIANNLANANTAGYKKDIAVAKDFRSMLISRINDSPNNAVIGSMGAGAFIDETPTVHTNGALRTTGNPLDVAIEGKGFFAVESPNGLRYTRNGSFSRNGQGELVTMDGYKVMGTNGPISIADAKKVSIAEDGRVMVQNNTDDAAAETEAGTLKIVNFADEKKLVKEGDSLFRAEPDAQEEKASALVHQGTLEQSNVNVVSEMINMITGYRAYEINSKLVQAHDQLLDKAVNSVGNL